MPTSPFLTETDRALKEGSEALGEDRGGVRTHVTNRIAEAVNVHPRSCQTEFRRFSGSELVAKSLKVKCSWNRSENCTRENWENQAALGVRPRQSHLEAPPTSLSGAGRGGAGLHPGLAALEGTPGSWDAGTGSSRPSRSSTFC